MFGFISRKEHFELLKKLSKHVNTITSLHKAINEIGFYAHYNKGGDPDLLKIEEIGMPEQQPIIFIYANTVTQAVDYIRSNSLNKSKCILVYEPQQMAGYKGNKFILLAIRQPNPRGYDRIIEVAKERSFEIVNDVIKS